ncbi:MAG: SRPBCC family protein [Streptomycetaceae bacterium]|nr:SRPBCC family protein [Streptomycetaceae bacterium]
MSDPQVLVERRVAATPERVWQVLTDPEGAAGALRGVSGIEVLTPGPFGVGTRWRETRTSAWRSGGFGRSGGAGRGGKGGRGTTEEVYVTAYDPPHRFVAEADAPGVHYVAQFTVVPDLDDTAVLRVALTATATGGTSRLLARLFGHLGAGTAAAVQQDVADLAAAAERGAGRPG